MAMMRSVGKNEPKKKKPKQPVRTESGDKEPREQAPTPIEVVCWGLHLHNMAVNVEFHKKDRSIWVNNIEVETTEEPLKTGGGVAVKFEIFEKEAVITFMRNDRSSNDICEMRYAGSVVQLKGTYLK